MTDTDIPGLAGTVRDVEAQLRDHYKATAVDIDTNPSGTEEGVTYRLQFRGFTDLDAALDRIGDVARDLEALPETTSVHAGVNSAGGYDHHTDETDERPMGFVNADLEVTDD